VSERATLVAEQRGRVMATTHLLRYYADERAGKAYRDAGDIHWLLLGRWLLPGTRTGRTP
jgi:hypothetical protein